MTTKYIYLLPTTIAVVGLLFIIKVYIYNQLKQVITQPTKISYSEETVDMIRASMSKDKIFDKTFLSRLVIEELYKNNKPHISSSFKKNMIFYYLFWFVPESKQINYILYNTTFGEDIVGFEAASDKYFNLPFGELTLSQKAVIVGIQPNPIEWDPYKDLKDGDGVSIWKIRAKYILGKMFNNGYISMNRYDNAVKEIDVMLFLPEK